MAYLDILGCSTRTGLLPNHNFTSIQVHDRFLKAFYVQKMRNEDENLKLTKEERLICCALRILFCITMSYN
jgi:hypothetical protein